MKLLQGKKDRLKKSLSGCAGLLSIAALIVACQDNSYEDSNLYSVSPTSSTSKISDSSSQLQWEECEIVPVTESIPMTATPNMIPINFTYLWFAAQGMSPGSTTIFQTQESDEISSEELSSGIIDITPKRQAMLETLKQALLEQGWVEVEQGGAWYNLHFRRKLSSETNSSSNTQVESNQSEGVSSGIQLFRMYQDNFVEAESKYKGKTLTLDGEVTHIAPKTDTLERTVGAYVYISDKETPNGNGGLVLNVANTEQLTGIKLGSQIEFTCTVGNWDGVPMLLLSLENCSIQ